MKRLINLAPLGNTTSSLILSTTTTTCGGSSPRRNIVKAVPPPVAPYHSYCVATERTLELVVVATHEPNEVRLVDDVM